MICEVKGSKLPDPSEIDALQAGMCPVNWALDCVAVARLESCGNSVMCRDGMTQLRLIVSDIAQGKAQSDDTELMKELCGVIASSNGCEIGVKAAANLLYSMERYPEEWDQHTRRKRCSALVCKDCYAVVVQPDQCTACGDCIRACPVGAIRGGAGLISVVDEKKCIRCLTCLSACPAGVITKAETGKIKTPEEPVPVGSFEAAGGGGRRRRRSGGE